MTDEAPAQSRTRRHSCFFTEPLRTWTGEAKKTILHGAATACRVATTRCKHQSRHTTLIANYPLTRLNWPNTSQFSPHSALYDATSTFHVNGKSGPFLNLFPFSHLLSVSSFIFLHSFCEPNESRARKRRRRHRKLARQKSHPIPEQVRQSVAQRVFQSRVSVSAARVKGITGRKGNGKRTRNQFILNNSSLVFDTNSLIFPYRSNSDGRSTTRRAGREAHRSVKSYTMPSEPAPQIERSATQTIHQLMSRALGRRIDCGNTPGVGDCEKPAASGQGVTWIIVGVLV